MSMSMTARPTPTEHADELLEAVKLAYRKHHLGDDSIGWEELSEKLGDVLCEVMGDAAFVEWMKEVKP